jgi:putative membrane protein
MTPHPNLTKTLLVLGLTGCISTMPAQNTPTTAGQSQQSSGQTTNRQSNTSGQAGTSGSTSPAEKSGSTTGATSGDRSHGGQQGTTGTSANRNRTAGSTELMVGQTDLNFMNEAARSGLMEVQAATLAQQKAQNDEVKRFAQQLLDDHNKANQELQALAAQKNVTLPADMGPKNQQQIAKMQNWSDAQFDRQWIKMQVDHHKQDVREFQRHSNRSMDSHVKAFAEKNLPTLQQHLQTAQNLQQTATRSRSANTSAGSTSGNRPDNASGDQAGAAGTGATSDTNNQNNDATRKPQGQNNPTTQK